MKPEWVGNCFRISLIFYHLYETINYVFNVKHTLKCHLMKCTIKYSGFPMLILNIL